MANKKTGFQYYSVETDRYQDIKIKRLKKDFKGIGVAVYDYILTEIYRDKGCFIEWDESTAFDVAEYWDIKDGLLNEIVHYCCHVGLFNKELLASERILSSKAILTRWIDWSIKAKRIDFEIPKNVKILLEESAKLPEECGANSGDLPQSNITQPKVKELEVKVVAAKKPPPESLVPKKKNTEEVPEPFWQELIAVWFDFGIEKFNVKPSFAGQDPKIFKRIISLLKKRAAANQVEWTQDTGPRRLRLFLDAAFADDWLSKHFLLSNLEKQYDSIIQNQRQAAEAKKVSESSEVNKAAASIPVNSKIAREIDYLYGRYCESEVTIRSIEEAHYFYLNGLKLLDFNEDEIAAIGDKSTNYILENNFQQSTESYKKYCKKFAVIEYFKQRQLHEQSVVA